MLGCGFGAGKESLLTDKKWLSCTDPERMLESFLGKASERKIRLFAVACCQRIRHLLTHEASREALQVAEAYADKLLGFEERQSSWDAAFQVLVRSLHSLTRDSARQGSSLTAAEFAAWAASRSLHRSWINVSTYTWQQVRDAVFLTAGAVAAKNEATEMASLMRCIFGNPFKPVTIDPAWVTANVVALAQTIYDQRSFEVLPILGDALEDAGCDNADILEHCRSGGEHVRGCWVVDLVLEKE
jgi:hypothetical protein